MTTELFSVKTIPAEYKRLYGRDTDLFDVIELLPIVLRNTHAVPPEYVFIKTKSKDFKVILPCVYYSVKYVVTPEGSCYRSLADIVANGQGILVNYSLKDWQETMAEANGDVIVNQVPVDAVKVNKDFRKEASGTYVDFEARGNVITVGVDNLDLEIMLTIMPVDKDGYPMVTEQVITAAAAFINMVYCQKRYYSGQLAKYVFDDARKDYNDYVGDAFTPQSISENELNDIMNALSSYNRHSYNKSLRV